MGPLHFHFYFHFRQTHTHVHLSSSETFRLAQGVLRRFDLDLGEGIRGLSQSATAGEIHRVQAQLELGDRRCRGFASILYYTRHSRFFSILIDLSLSVSLLSARSLNLYL